MFNNKNQQNENIISINALKAIQPIGEFYVCIMDAKTLEEMSKTDILKISTDGKNLYEGIQRSLKTDKVNKIVAYLNANEATFPNSIILNLDKKYFVGYEDSKLQIIKDEKAFKILDGQHRIAGLKKAGLDNFEVVLSIFIGLEDVSQSKVFVTINTEQTKVDPSLALYQEIYDKLYTPRNMVVKIAEMFSVDKASPWSNIIKITGRKDDLSSEGLLSLFAFAKPIIDHIYDDTQYYLLRNELENGTLNFEKIKKKKLWEFYLQKNESNLYKILFNYFSAMKVVLNKDWGNSDSLLTKTTGYYAMMSLFSDLYDLGYDKKDLSQKFFEEHLVDLRSLSGKINTKSDLSISPSGEQASKDLYQIFRKCLKL